MKIEMYDSLILLENSSNIQTILSEIKLSNSKIITFDVESDFKLTELGINHEIIENYIDINDEEEIDSVALQLAMSWHKEKNFKNLLEFQNINLGWLLETEFHQYLLQIIKYFIGMTKIFKKEIPKKIFSSYFLSTIINSFDFNSEIDLQVFPKKTSPKFYFDEVEIPINLGIKKFNLKTSRNFALKIKTILEKSTNIFFNLAYQNTSSSKKQILFLEFNPVHYKELIKSISSNGFEIIFLNERRPAVWNLESLKIIKKYNCKILRLSELETSISKTIFIEKTNFFKKLEKLFLLEDNLREVFSIRNMSFWPVIKEDFMLICKERFSEAINRIMSSSKFFQSTKIHSILTMYNAGVEERAILSIAEKNNIFGVLMQHGLYAQNRYMRKFIPVIGSLPNLSLKEAIWGDEIKQYFLELGIDTNDLILSGSPRHDEYFNHRCKLKNNNSILLATNVIMANNYKGIDSKVYRNLQIGLKKILDDIEKISEKQLIVKLHPGKPPIDIISNILSESKTSFKMYKTGNILPFILNSDIVISTELSTVLIESMILKKPTITFLFDKKGFENEKIITSGATAYVSDIQEFSKLLLKVLTDKNYQNQLIQRGTEFVNQYMINQGNSSKFLAKFLTEIK